MKDLIAWFTETVYRLRPEIIEGVIFVLAILLLLNFTDSGGG